VEQAFVCVMRKLGAAPAEHDTLHVKTREILDAVTLQ